ncbi:MAG: hypothetical protein K8F59_01890, partial [Rhodobacteraceae bacterium]|nr:hypothetical protein [Paracoccaceae bacterium]
VLITFKNPMSITPYAPSWFKPGQGCTWVSSQWQFWPLPGQFSVAINTSVKWLGTITGVSAMIAAVAT